MNSLSGRFVIIVLSIQEGRGFERFKNPMFILANLNGRKIESDIIDPCSNPFFSTELVWETEKKEVRKLRSSHIPLRIEVMTTDSYERREKVGFIMLNLRSAQAITSPDQFELEYKWHKLIGVTGDLKQSKPELFLTLTIRDKKYKEVIPPYLPIVEQTILEEGVTYELDRNLSNISVSLLEEGYIQIGPNSPTNQVYILSFVIRTAYNLDTLLPESSVFINSNSKYYISLLIFDITLNTKYFFKDLHEPIVLNDKFMLKIQADLEILRVFFGQFTNINLFFMKNEIILGTTQISLKHFDRDDLFQETDICTYDMNCGLEVPQELQIPEVMSQRKPFINVETVIEKNVIQVITDEYKDDFAIGDPKEFINLEDGSGDMREIKMCNKETCMRDMKRPIKDTCSQTSPRGIRTNIAVCSISTQELVQHQRDYIHDDYKLFVLTASFKSITWKRTLDIDGFRFSFHHPRAKTVLTIHCDAEYVVKDENITLEDVRCSLRFLSTPGTINSLVAWYPIKVTVCNLEDKRIAESFDLYTKMLLTQNRTDYTYFALLNGAESEEIICDIHVDITLKEYKLNSSEIQRSNHDLEPLIIDEDVVFKSMLDLENWKESQKEVFNARLQKIQSDKFVNMQKEWKEKRDGLERELMQRMEKCRILSNELSFATEEMRKKKQTIEHMQLSENTTENIEVKVTKMLEEEMNNKIEKIVQDKHRLKEKIEQLREDKEHLKTLLKDKEEELEDVKRTTLTKEQTSCLLQEIRELEEKYHHAQNAKNFFKEKWQRAAKEAHALKSKDQQLIQREIRLKKEQLSQLSLENFDACSDKEETMSSYSLPYLNHSDSSSFTM